MSTSADLSDFEPPLLARLPVREFQLAMTLESGQTFHWHKTPRGWLGLDGAAPLYLEQRAEGLFAPEDQHAAVRRYFSLDRSFSSLRRSLPEGDENLSRALCYAKGLRLIRQPDWETLATFIMSSMKKVAHIRVMSLALREKWGTPVEWCGAVLRAFPTPEQLAMAGEEGLRSVGLGYRAPLLAETALLARVAPWRAWHRLSDAELEVALRAFPGVGPKIARCAMLFGFQRDAAFPLDTWIYRVLSRCYFPEKRVSVEEVDRWAVEYFGRYAGWAQQCLFHWAREGGGLQQF